MLEKVFLNDVFNIIVEAGNKILNVYYTDFKFDTKEDKSPVTEADQRAHEYIAGELNKIYPGIPLLSEEGKHLSYAERKKWEYFWMVDPLDGTKEFIKRNGEFTVNIALIHNNSPVLGFVYAPVAEKCYLAKSGLGAYKLEKVKDKTFNSDEQLTCQAVKLPLSIGNKEITAVASRSHMSQETQEYLDKIKNKFGSLRTISAGSSLKLCLVAEGTADVYPRFAPTMEWDTAAGQAVVEQAGGIVVKAENKEKLAYNKEELVNPWFIAAKKGYNVQL